MSANAELTARRRSETGKGAARKIRAAGLVPAVVYGKGQDPIPLTVDAKEASHLFESISVENTIVNLRVEDEAEGAETLVREIQTHPFRPDVVHVDFYRLQRGVAIEVDVPINYVGAPEGVRHGGVLEVIGYELRVKCIPSKFPETIEVDTSALEIGDSIHAGDLEMDEDVELLTDPVRTLCLVAVPKVEDEEAEEEAGLAERFEAAVEEGAADLSAQAGAFAGGDKDSER